ncbi:MAG: hypothetical protein JWQ16_3499 [Novosphingobium sp.]|jgi:hypothetical protein|nr:hypothetical protein [Novosphingobium sp.]
MPVSIATAVYPTAVFPSFDYSLSILAIVVGTAVLVTAIIYLALGRRRRVRQSRH